MNKRDERDIGALLRAEIERLVPEPTAEQSAAEYARFKRVYAERWQMGSHPRIAP